ncbi:lysosomal acid glucosylceramidase-like [Penaeus japonicus]|uniref:lysosomal acid glucosylceramidase-like n=1 Tax=Penaeus japonicus TaxID=27405 RepID=UPI001C71716F|nr:lysosomal acid glucosylceramidase-like [Penaeus japonicus]
MPQLAKRAVKDGCHGKENVYGVNGRHALSVRSHGFIYSISLCTCIFYKMLSVEYCNDRYRAVDWNLALDTTGGPNWAANRVDAPIIVNATADEFYKQPMFYALGHFSKFVPGGSVHVSSRVVKGDGVSDGVSDGGDDGDGELHSAAFIHADGGCVLILLNTESGLDGEQMGVPLEVASSITTPLSGLLREG